MSNEKETGVTANDGKVGYCKPPMETRFKKGQSGNPRGSARRTRAMDELNRLIMEEAYRPVRVRTAEGTKQMPAITAILHGLIAKGLKGSGPAQRAVLNKVQSIEAESVSWEMQYLKSAIEYKVNAEQEIERRRKAGNKNISDIVPHPDDILIDLDRGVALIKDLNPKDHAKLRKLGLK